MFKHATMNRAYRLVWSELHNTWVAVAEFARTRGKRASGVVAATVVMALGATAAGAVDVPLPTALPTNGQVAAGQVGISTSGARMDVNQSSNSAIVNWDTFNIGSQAHVNFAQPSASSVILNRVMGGDGSAIFGRMTANGSVFITNPSGILFAPGAQVDVGGLAASSLGISDTNFLAGKYNFVNAGGAGTVVNQGTINALNGGFVALIAPQVSNSGTITAASGSIGLAAGDSVNLDFDHDGMLSFQVNLPAAAARADNTGVMVADGGRVVMNASAKDALLSTVLNNEGVIRARSLESRNGEIWLGGGNSGVVSVTGTLDASGTAAGQAGGTVKVLGDKVGLFDQAKIDVSGVGSGGTALVGGNFQGKGPEQNASMTYVGKDVTINADAVGAGDGGKVIVWADDTTRFFGNISARGGQNSGNGGFAEVSGKQFLTYAGLTNLGAPAGKTGTLLLDPDSFTIVHATDALSDAAITGAPAFTPNPNDNTTAATISDFTINAQLATPADVSITTSGGDITSQAAVDITLNSRILTYQSAAGINLAGTYRGAGTLALNFVTTLNLTGAPSFLTAATVTATGNGTSTIAGPNIANAWAISGANAGSLVNASGTVGFSGVAGLTGGTVADTFTLSAGVTFGGTIDGAAGTDELKATDGTNAWVSTGSKSGTFNT
ncbi:MAG: filamentous hemagglutinin N-terminal domain-containing protein, partial [Sulfuritalea sp.]|nr:filamentous hemagglutinin N-terminal domain-containing protein [Sulfuritalea sp.]